ncbi:MAG: NeuD/PglB/VioB family sugar acetyltransferase [Anaerolineales bacterium]|nr:NeuD/PglB/VioB family sugar acetyltransferase [Anaerolineales bacterium]
MARDRMGDSDHATPNLEGITGPYDQNSLLIYGGGGHGKSIIDLIRLIGKYKIIGIVDDGLQSGEQILGCAVLGDDTILEELFSKGLRLAVNAVGGVGDIGLRVAIFHKLTERGFEFPTLIHPSAMVESSAHLDSGIQVLPQSYVGTDAKVGFGVIINNGAIVSHDCVLGEYASLAPGAILAGGVHIGESTQVGMGVTINLNVIIGGKAQIGNGAVVKDDVPDGGIVHAGQIWPPR